MDFVTKKLNELKDKKNYIMYDKIKAIVDSECISSDKKNFLTMRFLNKLTDNVDEIKKQDSIFYYMYLCDNFRQLFEFDDLYNNCSSEVFHDLIHYYIVECSYLKDIEAEILYDIFYDDLELNYFILKNLVNVKSSNSNDEIGKINVLHR